MNATQKETIKAAVKTGFTFKGDSHFKTFRSAKTAITALVKSGYLVAEQNSFGTQYVPTLAAKDLVTYGIEA